MKVKTKQRNGNCINTWFLYIEENDIQTMQVFFRSEYLSIEPCVEQQVFRFEDQGEVLGGVALQLYNRSMVY